MDYIWVLDYIKGIKYLTINYIQICKYLIIILAKIISKLYKVIRDKLRFELGSNKVDYRDPPPHDN